MPIDVNKSISVILPNYNGRRLLENNLPSLLKALAGFEKEIIIVDDCSADDSVKFLESTYPEIKILINEVNLGFSATCNRGIFAATSPLICVVNTDVTFTPDYFSKLIPAFDETSIFAIKGDIVNYDTSFDDVLNIDRTTALYYKRGFLRFNTNNPYTSKTLLSESDGQFVGLGCCFVSQRELLVKLNGFDEIYSPFYWEDCDLAIRALEAGYKLLYLPEAKVFHQASSTISNYRSDSRRRLISNRNKFLFTWYHLGRKKLFLSHIPVTIMNLLVRWITLDWKYYAAFAMAVNRQLSFNRPSQKDF